MRPQDVRDLIESLFASIADLTVNGPVEDDAAEDDAPAQGEE